jgi:hypothetical protein
MPKKNKTTEKIAVSSVVFNPVFQFGIIGLLSIASSALPVKHKNFY